MIPVQNRDGNMTVPVDMRSHSDGCGVLKVESVRDNLMEFVQRIGIKCTF